MMEQVPYVHFRREKECVQFEIGKKSVYLFRGKIFVRDDTSAIRSVVFDSVIVQQRDPCFHQKCDPIPKGQVLNEKYCADSN